jgi:hypothetical protein
MAFLNNERLFGIGIGYVDLHLLAATRLDAGTRLWTRDRRLLQAALPGRVRKRTIIRSAVHAVARSTPIDALALKDVHKQGSTMVTLGWIVLAMSAGGIIVFMRHKIGKEIDRGCPF